MKQAVRKMRVRGKIDLKLSNGEPFQADKWTLIHQIMPIIESYFSRGIPLTIRQLYYQLVSKKNRVMPNDIKTYKKLSEIVTDLREAGYVDWDAIEDRHRDLASKAEFTSPINGMDVLIGNYQLPRQEGMPAYMEVWLEKDSLSNLVYQVTSKYGIPLLISKGYNSATAIWEASRRFVASKVPVKVLYLGDHDPSGLDMVRDIGSRLRLYAPKGNFEIRRVALLRDHVDQYSLPPNPAKETDSRYKWYLAEYGEVSWEVDALESEVFQSLVEHEIQQWTDMKKLHAIKAMEEQHKLILHRAKSSIKE